MDTRIDIQLSEHAFVVLSNQATMTGKSPEELAASVVESVYGGGTTVAENAPAARADFRACFGSVDLGHPIGIANDAIDRDLANEYAVGSN